MSLNWWWGTFFVIPFSCFYNIKIGPLFDLVMVGTYKFIYTRTIDVKFDDALDLLKDSDQYLLEDLKLIWERVMAKVHWKLFFNFHFFYFCIKLFKWTTWLINLFFQGVSQENVLQLFEFSEDVSANTLKHACILYMLRKFDKLNSKPWYVIFNYFNFKGMKVNLYQSFDHVCVLPLFNLQVLFHVLSYYTRYMYSLLNFTYYGEMMFLLHSCIHRKTNLFMMYKITISHKFHSLIIWSWNKPIVVPYLQELIKIKIITKIKQK